MNLGIKSVKVKNKREIIYMKTKRRYKIINIIIAIILLLSILSAVYFYYCPSDYVKTSKGDVYLRDGKPYIYHTDPFGNTFIFEDGVRVYVAIPNYID